MNLKNKQHSTVPTPPETPPAPAPAPVATAPVPVPPAVPPPAPPIAEAELQQIQERAARADENWDRFLRATADLDNYRKRVAREREELVRAANERVVAALLPVLDNLERALAAAETVTGTAPAAGPATGPDPLLDGVKQIQVQFRRTLEQFGLQEIAAHAGHPFDPNVHEAISHVEHPDHPEGAVTQQLQRGYKLADRLLRPARVVVSKGKAAAADKPAAAGKPKIAN